MELVCPAGTLQALKVAVDNGADCVYTGLRDQTNARNFAGLNFGPEDLVSGVRYAHSKGAKVFVAVNTYPQPDNWERWCAAIDQAAALGVDAVIVADLGLMAYAAREHPRLRIHLSVQGSATSYEAINFYVRRFNVARAVLPRVLTLSQVQRLIERCDAEVEVFGFGSLCVMAEGRCSLSSYVTGEGPNLHGACSPAKAVRWQQTPAGLESRLNGVLVDRYGDGEKAAYPTLCKGRYRVGGEPYYAIEAPSSLNTLELLPQLQRIGVAAIKIEGRQRGPAYVAAVTRVFRQAMDACERDPGHFRVAGEWRVPLDRCSEGQQVTLGPYDRPWR
ncbi:MAG: U32 family peptidase [Burkholderiales bacterium]|nr:U32 family peptidase [Burkholderiales bacterium]